MADHVDALLPGIAALGFAAVALLTRYNTQHWLRWGAERARLATDGVQEVTIRVRNGYHPNTIRVRAGSPVRLIFQREDDNPCAARVYLSEPPLSRSLAPFAATTVAFTPRQVGDHLFTCEEGRFRGHLIIEPPVPPRRGREAASSATTAGATLSFLSASQLRLMPVSGLRVMLRIRDIAAGVSSLGIDRP